MNKTVIKDILREIKSNLGRFFSIMALLSISMIAFSGVFTATMLLERVPKELYEDNNLYDVVITSTGGLTETDEIIIGSNPLVDDFEMIKSVDLFLKDTSKIIRIENFSNDINTLILMEGRLPKNSNEMVLSYDFFKEKINLQDKIEFVNEKNEEDIEELHSNTFEVVGFVRSLDHLSKTSRDVSTLGSGLISSFGYVTDQSFDTDYFTKSFIKGIELKGLDSSSNEYEESLQILLKNLEDSFEERPKTRREEIQEEASKEIKEAEMEIEDAKRELEEAKKELEEGREELDQGKIDLLNAEIEIKEGEISLMEARRDLNDGWKKYEDGLIELKEEEIKGRNEIQQSKRELEDAKIKLDDARKKLAEGRKEYEDGLRELEVGKKEFADGEKLYNDNLKLYQDGRRELDEMKEKIRISKEIRLGEINKIKNKEELESKITSLESQIESHKTNISNYKAQLEYNKSILETSDDKEAIEGKIGDLNNLINSEEGNLNKKLAELSSYKDQLSNFEKVQREGRLSDEVIDYSDESIEEGEKKLRLAKSQLDEAKIELEKGRAELQKGIDKVEEGRLELEKGERELRDGEAKYNQGLIDLRGGEKTLENEINKGRRELEEGKRDLEQGEEDYKQGLLDLKEGKRKYEEGLEEYQEGLKEFEEGEKEFEEKSSDALKEISKGEAEILDAKAELIKLKEPKFIIDSRNSNNNYMTIAGYPKSLRILAIVLSILALLIALLVAFTTMTRMVDERRVLIGTYKGLGYTKDIISSKFILFGGISGVIGTILGNVIGQKIVGPLIYVIYMEGMIFENPPSFSSRFLFMMGMVLALITTTYSAYLSANKTLKENTASLLRPKAPKAGSRMFLERIGFIWNNLGFMNKITARNIFRYKGRMSMTIIGVAGCMAILILGFGMKFSIKNVVKVQFEEIQNYDVMFSIEEELESSDLEKTISNVENNSNVENLAITNTRMLKLQIPGIGTQDVSLIVDLDDNLDKINNFRTRKGKNLIEFSDDGVILTEKLASLMDLKIGDTFKVEIEDETREMEVKGISEYYIGHNMYMTKDYFEKLIGDLPKPNMLLADLVDNSSEEESLTAKEILTDKNVITSISTSIAKDAMEETVNSIDMVIYIIVLIAMLLSLVVLYNLTNINVSERIRELSTMKVLGFFPKELIEYVYKETFMLSVIGIIGGMALGKLIVDFVINSFAPTNIMFGYPNYPIAFGISSVLTLFFTFIVMIMMHIKLKNIDMVEALKSVD